MKEEKSFYGFREKGQGSRFQSFALELVAGCQLRCGNCYREPAKQKDPGLMPAEFVYRVIESARDAGFAEIVLIGGEPTLHNDLPKFIAAVLKNGLTPILCTNGLRLADDNYCHSLALPGTVVVIHGLIPMPTEEFDRHAQMPGYAERLKRAYQNLNPLRQEGVQVVSETVIIRPFLPYLSRFHKQCREDGLVPFIEINRRGNNGQPNGLSVAPEEIRDLFCQLQDWDIKNMPELADRTLTPPAYGNKCTMSITGLHVKNFGNGNFGGVYSCCAQTVCHGNLKKKSLAEIISDPSVLIFKDQDRWIAGPCRQCELYQACKGGCRGEAVLAFGCSRASSPACWHLAPGIRQNPKLMMPPNCDGCPIEGRAECRPRR